MRWLRPSEAAEQLGISYPTLKQWIYQGKLRSVKTAGGHHRVSESEVDRLSGREPMGRTHTAGSIVSGRNKLTGRITDVRLEGLLAQVVIDLGTQSVTSIITRSAAEEMRLRPGISATALIKATEVMIIRE